MQVTAHADDHGAAGAVNLFAHVSGGRRIPRLAMLVDSVYMDLNAGERRDIASTCRVIVCGMSVTGKFR